MTWIDFRKAIAEAEHVPIKSVELVGYDLTKFDFSVEKDDTIMISNVYTNTCVKYQVKDNKPVVANSSKVVYGNAVTKQVEERVNKKYPFSKGAPHWAIAMLQEGNNVDDVEKAIQFYNKGGEMIDGQEDLKQSHKQGVSFMTIHDLCITEMQQQDVEANAGDIVYTIRVHSVKSKEEENGDKFDDQMISLNDKMPIKDLKSYILSLTEQQPFHLKFHMNNDQTLQDLINRTRNWNTQRDISNDEGALRFDIFLDRVNFDLHLEVDLEKEKVRPINPDATQDFKHLTVCNLNGQTSLQSFFDAIKKGLTKKFNIKFSKTTNFAVAVELENGTIIQEEKGNWLKKSSNLSDYHVTRFSTIKFFATDKENTFFNKAGEDYIRIDFPEYLRSEFYKIPVGNKDFDVCEIIIQIHKKVIVDEKVKGLENIDITNFSLYKQNQKLDLKQTLGKYFELKKNPKTQMIYNFTFDMTDVIVLRPFGAHDYIFLKYNRALITNLSHLREKITWKHLDSLDDELKNKDLKEENAAFRSHLQLSYQHQKILLSDELKYILPQEEIQSEQLLINIFLDSFVGRDQVYQINLRDKWMALQLISTCHAGLQEQAQADLDKANAAEKPKKKQPGLFPSLFGGGQAPAEEPKKVDKPSQDQYDQMMKQFRTLVKNDDEKLAMSKKILDREQKAGNENEELFKMLIKAYSDDKLYRPINDVITKGQYELLQGYLSLLLKNLSLFGKGLSYKQYTKPVYRGFNPSSPFYKKDDYARNAIGTWTTFQSCTTDKKVALGFSKTPQGKSFSQKKELLIFEIYLNKENNPPTQIEMNSSMSWYPAEKEILCLPMFTFQVVNVIQDTKLTKQENDVNAYLTTVTLVEIPYQNMLNMREVRQNTLIWFDEPEKEVVQKPEEKKNKDDSDGSCSSDSDSDDLAAEYADETSPHELIRDMYSKQVKNEFNSLVNFKFCNDKAKTLHLIKSSVKTTLMVSGRAGLGLVDSLFEYGLTPSSNVSNVVIFCNTVKKLEELQTRFMKKKYEVSMEFVMYDQEGKYLKQIEKKVQECLNNTHAQKMKEQVKDFQNDFPYGNKAEAGVAGTTDEEKK